MANHPKLKHDNTYFIQEYLDLNYMKLVTNKSIKYADIFYISHHAVMNGDSLTTKLRVVFDDLAKTNNNLNLKDILMVGTNLQQDVFDILVRLRTHQYILLANIEKICQRIWLDSKQCDL